jgi:hypothetical protein
MMVGSRTPFLETGGCERLNLLNEKLMCICPHCALTAKLDMTLERRDPLHSPLHLHPPSLFLVLGLGRLEAPFRGATRPSHRRSRGLEIASTFSSGNHRIADCCLLRAGSGASGVSVSFEFQ